MSEIKVFDVQQTIEIFTALKDKVNSLKIVRQYLYMNSHWENNTVLNMSYGDDSNSLSYTNSTNANQNVLVLTSVIDNAYGSTGGTKTINTTGDYIVPDYNYNASSYNPQKETNNIWVPSLGHIGIAQIELEPSESISTSLTPTGGQYSGCYIIYIPIEIGRSFTYVTSGTLDNTGSLSYDYTFNSGGHYLAVMVNRKYGPASMSNCKIKLNDVDIENTQYQAPQGGYQPSFIISEFEADMSDEITFTKTTSGDFEHIFIILKFPD